MTDYRTKLVSCTADGANVNMGQISGLLTRIGHDRDWMLKIHCANHRVELAVKGAFKETKFLRVDEFYLANFNATKNSGKPKNAVQSTASDIEIEYYVLSKSIGTRSIGQRASAYKTLLDMWPAFITAYIKCISDPSYSNIKSKVKGHVEKFQSCHMLCLVSIYLDELKKMVPASKIFEGEGLLAFDIKNTIDLTSLGLYDCRESAGTNEEFLDSFLACFKIIHKDGNSSLSSKRAETVEILKHILTYKRTEFPNVCFLLEIIISVSGSNSSVERAFSILRKMLSDERLFLKHKRMELILTIAGNNKN